jgi:hypothetical protein
MTKRKRTKPAPPTTQLSPAEGQPAPVPINLATEFAPHLLASLQLGLAQVMREVAEGRELAGALRRLAAVRPEYAGLVQDVDAECARMRAERVAAAG